MINPVLRWLLGTPLAGSMRKQFMVLNFTGRKTGRAYSVPVSAHEIDDALYALAGAGWKANFRGGAAASVLHDGKTVPMRGELVKDPAIVADLYHRCASAYGARRAQRAMGLKFRDGAVPTFDEFREAVSANGL